MQTVRGTAVSRGNVLADPAAPSLIRRGLRAWLEQLGSTVADIDDVLTAASEAVSTAAEHAYPPGHPSSGWRSTVFRSPIPVTVSRIPSRYAVPTLRTET